MGGLSFIGHWIVARRILSRHHPKQNADVSEMVDDTDLGSVGRDTVWVQVPPPAPYAPVAQSDRAKDF